MAHTTERLVGIGLYTPQVAALCARRPCALVTISDPRYATCPIFTRPVLTMQQGRAELGRDECVVITADQGR